VGELEDGQGGSVLPGDDPEGGIDQLGVRALALPRPVAPGSGRLLGRTLTVLPFLERLSTASSSQGALDGHRRPLRHPLVTSVFFQSFFLHRYAAHRMYTVSPRVERVLHLLTYLVQGPSFLSPRGYAILHREHHAFSDTERDPHSPWFFRVR
jgi:hypothetical protein